MSQKLKINGKTIKLITEWHELTVSKWIKLHKLTGIESAYELTNIKSSHAYLITPEIEKVITELTCHFHIDKLSSMPVMFTDIRKYKQFHLPELVIINGSDLFLFKENAYTFCQAHDALTAAFNTDLRFIYEFAAYYMRLKGDNNVSEGAVVKRANKLLDMPMSVLMEVLYHHISFFNVLADKKHFPNLFGGKSNVNGNKLGGLGFTSFLHEWAMDKGVGINSINENVNDFFMQISYMRTMRQPK